MFLDVFFDAHARSRLQLGEKKIYGFPQILVGMPSMYTPASSDIIIASALMRDTAVCFSKNHMKSAQTYVIQICTERHLMLILIPLDVEHDRRLGIIPACSLLLDFLRESTVCNALCDECS